MTLAITQWLEPWQWQLLALSTLIKVLLIPTYHSTDFEVHRNWLAVTHSLPLSQWYFDERSIWTLDYPPFFAYFSWLLSFPAAYVDSRILLREEYAALRCKVYMRSTVIVTEALTYATALFALSKRGPKQIGSKHIVPPWCVAAMLLHPGLLIIDHIHFQYNGFLYGILLWSVWAARQGKPLLCAFLFSTLLNLKHIYVYVAPAYFVYLLKTYVLQPRSSGQSGPGERLFTLAIITLLPFVASLLPLLLSGLSPAAPAGPFGILKQMLSRLFPFSRGLNHAYWAANIWALYTFLDRILVKMLKIRSRYGNVTRGIIGDTNFDVLPPIEAGHCFLLTLMFTLVICVRLWRRPGHGAFVEAIGLFGLTSFLFGFHVHEKAIMIALIPLTLLANSSYTMTRKTFVLSVAGIVGLFPLLFEVRELPVKVALTSVWFLTTPIASTFGMRFPAPSSAAYAGANFTPTNVDLLVHFAEDVYVAGFVALVTYVEVIHPLASRSVAATDRQVVHPFTKRSGAASATKIIDALANTVSGVQTQNKLVSYASVAASSAVEAVTNALQPPTPPPGSLPETDLVSAASSAAAHVLSAGAAVMTDASDELKHVASSASSIAMAAVQTSTTAIDTTNRMEFLPLMLTSVYCAIGVVWVWVSLSARFVREQDDALDREVIEMKLEKKKV